MVRFLIFLLPFIGIISISCHRHAVEYKQLDPTVTEHIERTRQDTLAKEMVIAHNRWRQIIGVPEVKWSLKLATAIQAWINTLEKNDCQTLSRPNYGKYGENISQITDYQSSSSEIVAKWGKHQNTCRQCPFYAKLASAKVREIGCGVASCSHGQVWICSYD